MHADTRHEGIPEDNKSDDIEPPAARVANRAVAQRRSRLIFSRNITYYAYINIARRAAQQ